MNLIEITEFCKSVAIMAGEAIIEIYHQENFFIEHKDDNSPLTKADKIANEIIVSNLKNKYPTYAILSEESQDSPERLKNDCCFIVDPLDGTKEFISRNGQFTVNIALSYKGKPIVGVVYVPVPKELFFAYENGGAYHIMPDGCTKKIQVSNKTSNLIFVGSRSHLGKEEEQLLNEKSHLISGTLSVGSSLKGCMVAGGVADVYYRFGPTSREWDTAAMQCIVEQAGGVFAQMDNTEMTYNKKNIVNEKGFFAVNCKDNIWI